MKKRIDNKISSFVIIVILITSIFGAVDSALAEPGQGILYVTKPFNQELYQMDTGDGSVILVGKTNDGQNDVPLPSVALDPVSGTMYAGGGSSFTNLYTVNTATGAITLVGPTNNGNLVGLDFRSDGVLFAAVKPSGSGSATGGTKLGTVDTSNGDTTIIGDFGVSNLNSIAFFGNTLYGVSYDGNLYQINTGTGQASIVAQIGDGSIPFGASQFACDGTYYVGEGNVGDNFGTVDIPSGAYNVIALGIFGETMGGMAFSQTCQGKTIGGTLLPVDSTALVMAGIQTNALWMMPVVVGILAAGAYFIKTRLHIDLF